MAVPAQASRPQDIGRLLQVSGFTAQVAMIPQTIQDTLGHAGLGGLEVPINQREALLQAVAESFSAEKLHYGVGTALQQSLPHNDLRQLLDWYQSESGRRITQAEIAGATPGAYAAMQSMTQTLLEDDARLAVVQRICTAVNAVEFASHLAVAGYSLMAVVESPTPVRDVDSWSAQMVQEFTATQADLQMMVWLSFLYAYRHLDMPLLERYAAFLEGPSSMRFNELAINSLHRGLLSGLREVATASSHLYR